MRRRVLVVVDEFGVDGLGGSGVVSRALHQGLSDRAFEVGVLCAGPLGEDRWPTPTVDTFRWLIPKAEWQAAADELDVRRLRRLAEFDASAIDAAFSAFEPDVILGLHLWGLLPPSISHIAEMNVPVVYRFGDEWLRLHYEKKRCDVFWRTTFPNLERLSIENVVCNSQNLCDRVKPYCSCRTRIWLVRNGVDLEMFGPCFRDVERPWRLLMASRMVQHKGVSLAIGAAAQLLKAGASVHLTLAGPIPQYANSAVSVKTLIANAGLESYCDYVGEVPHEDMPRLLCRHDALLFPSSGRGGRRTVEGCPNILLEALASCTPVVAFEGSGVSEIIVDGENGVLCPSEDAGGLAMGVSRVLGNDKTWTRIRSTMTTKRSQHGVSRMLDNYVAVLGRILTGATTGSSPSAESPDGLLC